MFYFKKSAIQWIFYTISTTLIVGCGDGKYIDPVELTVTNYIQEHIETGISKDEYWCQPKGKISFYNPTLFKVIAATSTDVDATSFGNKIKKFGQVEAVIKSESTDGETGVNLYRFNVVKSNGEYCISNIFVMQANVEELLE